MTFPTPTQPARYRHRRRNRKLARTLRYAVLPVILGCLLGTVLIAALSAAVTPARAAPLQNVEAAAETLLAGIDRAPMGQLSANGGYDAPRIAVLEVDTQTDDRPQTAAMARQLAAALERQSTGRYRILDVAAAKRLANLSDSTIAEDSAAQIARADIVILTTREAGDAKRTPLITFQAISRSGGDLLAMADLRADRDATPTDWTPPTQPIVDNSIDSAPIAQNALASPYRPTVAEAEWRLSELGYTPGPIDGLLDAETRDALRAYQRDSALAPSGRMTRDTLNNMRRDTRLPGPAAFSDWEGVQ